MYADVDAYVDWDAGVCTGITACADVGVGMYANVCVGVDDVYTKKNKK